MNVALVSAAVAVLTAEWGAVWAVTRGLGLPTVPSATGRVRGPSMWVSACVALPHRCPHALLVAHLDSNPEISQPLRESPYLYESWPSSFSQDYFSFKLGPLPSSPHSEHSPSQLLILHDPELPSAQIIHTNADTHYCILPTSFLTIKKSTDPVSVRSKMVKTLQKIKIKKLT